MKAKNIMSGTNKSQIKFKKRVVEHGEVFTNEREVNAMLDLVPLWGNANQAMFQCNK